MPKPVDSATYYRGDALAVLPRIESGTVDAIVTDPPYSSGGMFRGDRAQKTGTKYVQSGCLNMRPDFTGDNRDQRSWVYWCALWMGECLRITKPSGYLLVFTDWRQLPATTDAIQAGGWIMRGIIAWDKTEGSRPPHTGYFRHQCEYICWATSGVSRPATWGGPWPGCFRFPVKQNDKHHQTGKPTPLLEKLVQCSPPGGIVLDPFMGSGTTGIACANTGRKFIGIELDEHWHLKSRSRAVVHKSGGVKAPSNGLLNADLGEEL